jgi:hypothetical protein
MPSSSNGNKRHPLIKAKVDVRSEETRTENSKEISVLVVEMEVQDVDLIAIEEAIS